MVEARSYSIEFTNHRQILDNHHNERLISVPAGRFVADASLSHRAELSWGRPMSRFASLQGLICDANPQGVAQPPLQSTYIWHTFNKCHP